MDILNFILLKVSVLTSLGERFLSLLMRTVIVWKLSVQLEFVRVVAWLLVHPQSPGPSGG